VVTGVVWERCCPTRTTPLAWLRSELRVPTCGEVLKAPFPIRFPDQRTAGAELGLTADELANKAVRPRSLRRWTSALVVCLLRIVPFHYGGRCLNAVDYLVIEVTDPGSLDYGVEVLAG
jgi:hypothetical protein